MNQDLQCQSDLEIIACKIRLVYDMVKACSIKIDLLQNGHVTSEFISFYAIKGVFDGKIGKFFIDRGKYIKVKEFANIRKLFGVKRDNCYG